MTRKLFIVDPNNGPLYATLRRTLANEIDVEIFCDRRKGRSHALRWKGVERRNKGDDVSARIRRDGFAVTRPSQPPAPERNIRWA